MNFEPREYKYETSLNWTGEHKGEISSPDKPEIQVACPPEWGGHAGIWSPEDMFVGAIELCTMTTFLWLLDRHDLEIESYRSNAVGTAKMVNKSFNFSEILVEPEVEISDEQHIEKLTQLFKDLQKYCIITKSVKCDVIINPKITVTSNNP